MIDLFLLSIKPEWVSKILSKEKTIELRKTFHKEANSGDIVFIYSSSPIKCLIGYFVIDKIETINKTDVTEEILSQSCVSREIFDDYYVNNNEAVLIYIKDLFRFIKTYSLEELKKEDKFHPPMSWKKIFDDKEMKDYAKKIIDNHKIISIIVNKEETFFKSFRDEYPNFDEWFENKIMKNEGHDERMFQYILDLENEDIIAFAIMKKSKEENKICSFKVNENCIRKGNGTSLMKSCIEWLQDDKPIISVSEKNIPVFEPFLDKFGFILTSVKEDYYNEGSNEYFFNERKVEDV